jgi:hypothetical protein
MKPEDRSALADIIRRGRDKIPAEIEKLRQEERELTAWLDEFAPDQEGSDNRA